MMKPVSIKSTSASLNPILILFDPISDEHVSLFHSEKKKGGEQ
jgi:hypothetical protein